MCWVVIVFWVLAIVLAITCLLWAALGWVIVVLGLFGLLFGLCCGVT